MNRQNGSENDPLIRRIENSIRSGRISHAYLLEGPAAVDKPAFARDFAKAILCPDGRGDGCGRCPLCSKIDHDNHEDLIYVRRQASKQTIGIDQIRGMQEQVRIKPNGERYIVIIEESGSMTEPAQNCLLKTLEEPPGGAILFLLTDNAEQLLPTIRSRCVGVRIEGSAETENEEMYRRAEELLQRLLSGSPFYMMKTQVSDLQRDREGAAELIDCMEQCCRQRILSRDEKGIPSSPEVIGRYVEGLETARRQLQRGMTPGYVLKRMLLINGG